MKKYFKNRMAAIDWIANHAEDEGQFEALRENLTSNFIYTENYYIDQEVSLGEIVLLQNSSG